MQNIYFGNGTGGLIAPERSSWTFDESYILLSLIWICALQNGPSDQFWALAEISKAMYLNEKPTTQASLNLYWADTEEYAKAYAKAYTKAYTYTKLSTIRSSPNI